MATEFGDGNSLASVEMAGPFGSGGSYAKAADITLYADQWKGAISPYSQVVTVEDVSVNSKVDLQLSVEQLEGFQDLCVALMAENDGGVVTVYAFGEKPSVDCTIQATITEVIA